jgi:allophanate hydrolase
MGDKRIPDILTISCIKEKYASGQLTPEILIDEISERISRDREYNIWIKVLGKSEINGYIANLEHIDRDAPLWGIPFAIKDNIDLAGTATTAACPKYSYIPSENAEAVRRIIAAGGIPIGKTNLDQFATGLVGVRSPYGEVHNAMREDMISGGSSSGSAVSVAKGEVAFALGTDTAGSGRVPAALNGLVGLKTSIGAWSTRGVVPACASLDCVTVLANNTDDAYTVDAAVRAVDVYCEWSRQVPVPESRRPKKVLLPSAEPEFYGPFSEKYRAAWHRSIERLRTAGIPVETADVAFMNKAAEYLYDGPWVSERWADLGAFISKNEKDVFPVTREILEGACKKNIDAAGVFTAVHQLQKYRLEAKSLMEDAVLIMPTCGGTYKREDVDRDPVLTNSNMGKYTNHCNLLDLAAIALPSGYADDGLPFGITAFSLYDKESQLRGFAEAYMKTEPMEIAVCGLHMKGFQLEHQLHDLGAVYKEKARTAQCYRMYRLNTEPPKPALYRSDNGASVEVEVWMMPVCNVGKFLGNIPDELSLGKIKLDDGSEVVGFLGQGEINGQDDITEYGGWRYYCAGNIRSGR